jgi:nucleoside-diphosphate-sugar epimerase
MPSDTSEFWAVNVAGLRNVLEAARDHGVGRVLHVSSVVTVGLDFPDRVDEWYPVRMTGVPYTDTKIAAEQVALMSHAAGEQVVTIVRPGDIYGPGSRPWTLLPLELMRSHRLALPAGGRGIHSPVYVDDVVEGMIAAAKAPAAAGRVITLSGGAGVTTADYFGRLGRIAGLTVPLVPTPVALAGATALDRIARLRGVPNELTADAVRYLAARQGTYGIETARTLLGWLPRVDLDDGMDRTAAWLRERDLV